MKDNSRIVFAALCIALSIPLLSFATFAAYNNKNDGLPPANAVFVLNGNADNPIPRFAEYLTRNSGLGDCRVIVDRDTKVMYLRTRDGVRGYLTPWLDSDGKPLLYDENIMNPSL